MKYLCRRDFINAQVHPAEDFSNELPHTAAVATPFREVVRQYLNNGGPLFHGHQDEEPEAIDWDNEPDPDEEPHLTNYQVHFAVEDIEDEPPETPAEPLEPPASLAEPLSGPNEEAPQ